MAAGRSPQTPENTRIIGQVARSKQGADLPVFLAAHRITGSPAGRASPEAPETGVSAYRRYWAPRGRVGSFRVETL